MGDAARKAAVLAGDESAWRAWYDECFGPLDAYVLWRCGGSRADADDVLQEAWLVAVRRLERFDPAAGPFLGWLRGIAANLLRNRFRKKEALPFPRPDAEPADAEAMRQEKAARVAEALASLPPHYEELLRMKYLEGLPVAEIAERRGETTQAAESALTRARAAFRAAYPEDEP
ncbi:MAG: sigma-70 family RNA polymerase sigma factor [Gemmataceae bacterium]|nr:sigma-70 family RNA polymerase sigma factor [Gemmataceae bacterium]